MKILYYSRPSFVDNDILLVRALHDLGHDVCFVLKIADPHKKSSLFTINEIVPTSGILPSSIYKELDWISKYVKCDFRVHNIPSFSTRKVNIKGLIAMDKLVSSFSPDVIHYIGNPEDITDLIMLGLYRRKTTITLHDPLPHSGESNKNVYYLKKIALSFIPKIILLNDKQTEEFMELYSVPSKKIFISRLGYFDWIELFAKKNTVESPYLLFYGRISPYKGLEYLLEALDELSGVIPDLKAIIAGSGKYHFDISYYQSLDNIHFINRYIETDELAELISNSSFVICPYTDATQSGVVNTVLALEKPVIVTNVGALADMVINNVNGLVIPPRDINAIKESILTLWKNTDLLKQMQESIKSESNSDASWTNIANRTVMIYTC